MKLIVTHHFREQLDRVGGIERLDSILNELENMKAYTIHSFVNSKGYKRSYIKLFNFAVGCKIDGDTLVLTTTLTNEMLSYNDKTFGHTMTKETILNV